MQFHGFLLAFNLPCSKPSSMEHILEKHRSDDAHKSSANHVRNLTRFALHKKVLLSLVGPARRNSSVQGAIGVHIR